MFCSFADFILWSIWVLAIELNQELKLTPLSDFWAALGARMVPFAGYNMPVQFPEGVVKEHLWTRENAGLFDVAHMGPCGYSIKDKSNFSPEEAHQEIAKLVEKILPCDVSGLGRGQIRYTVLLNESGGIIDDLMVARPPSDEAQGNLYIVVNAGGKEVDFEIFNALAPEIAMVHRLDDNALVALQGPKAKDIIGIIAPEAANLDFMTFGKFTTKYGEILISRSGYTGEDGFEILLLKDSAVSAVQELLANEFVKPIGLGARDSLRLEAGLCLYGHDLDQTISPIEAGLAWTIQKSRREVANFEGAERILGELANKPIRRRVGIAFAERAPAREGTIIRNLEGRDIGVITSGGFGPSLNAPLAMGYVETAYSAIDNEIDLIVRDTPRRAKICKMPFVAHNYFKKS